MCIAPFYAILIYEKISFLFWLIRSRSKSKRTRLTSCWYPDHKVRRINVQMFSRITFVTAGKDSVLRIINICIHRRVLLFMDTILFVSFYSVRTSSPIWWIMDGPRTVKHDFKEPFCAISLKLIVHNSSDDALSVCCNPSDSTANISSSGNASAASGNEVGWHDLSLSNDIKITTDPLVTRAVKPMSSDTVPPFIWSASSSTHFTLEPLSSRETPLEICVFSSGTFDLSNYALHWSLSSHSDQGDESSASSGTCQGHPFYITVLQQDWETWLMSLLYLRFCNM